MVAGEDIKVGESLVLIGDVAQISAHVLLGDGCIYMLGVRQTKENASSEVANKFLMSLYPGGSD